MKSFCAVSLGLVICLISIASHGEDVNLESLSGSVEVMTDDYGVPHIYADTWTDAAHVLGYLHARDRLWQMDIYRRQASGTTAEVLGPDAVASDTLTRQLGIRAGCQAVWDGGGMDPALKAELEAYTAGVNAYMARLAPQDLPLAFQAMDYAPAPWTPVDCMVFLKYMGWDQAGTDSDLWFGMMVDKLGWETANALWPLDRPYEIPSVPVQAERHPLAAAANLVPPPQAGYAGLMQYFAQARAFDHGSSFGSNNWAVSGAKTASGKPMLCSDPHLGFDLPSIWYTASIQVGDRFVTGVTFPGTPIVIIGHNDRLGWGITNMQADQVDFYVETINPDNGNQYQYDGEWRDITSHKEIIKVKGGEPVEVLIRGTVNGVLMYPEEEISMQWAGFGPTEEFEAIWRINRARNLDEFLDAADSIVTPALNLAYADVDGNIALRCVGALPLRLRGLGRVPMAGNTSATAWRGYIPPEEMPCAVNPPQGFVASANGRPAPAGYAHYLGWMWDPSYRTRRIHDMLDDAACLTLAAMGPIQNDAHDKAAEVFLPIFLDALAKAPVDVPLYNDVSAILNEWDYVASVDAKAPLLWLTWFDKYRRAVWDDEWAVRNIHQPGGSWGYTGDNRREPELEVLEYMTRELPESPWFDNQQTPERETRDDVIRASFVEALNEVVERHGSNPDGWVWRNFNVLRVGSLTGQPQLAREGGPVPGTEFTVNPGGDGGSVGGGASWRMIVDFGDVHSSIGVYPGGQSEDSTSPHYADQMPLWATGKYVSLYGGVEASALPENVRANKQRFLP